MTGQSFVSPQTPLVRVVALGQKRRQAVEDDHTGHRVRLAVVRVSSLPVSRAVPLRGLWENVQMSVAPAVQGRLEDRIGESDGRLLVCRTRAPQGLVPRQPGSGKVNLFQAVNRDDCRTGQKMRKRQNSTSNKSDFL